MDSGSPVVCLHNSTDMCSAYYVSGFFSFRNRNDRCQGDHSILSSVLDKSGNNILFSFVTHKVKFPFYQKDHLELNKSNPKSTDLDQLSTTARNKEGKKFCHYVCLFRTKIFRHASITLNVV